jgi:hypothetical protein
MKTFILTIAFCLLTTLVFTQNVSINYIYKLKPTVVERFNGSNFKDKVVLKMPFASDSILNPASIKGIQGKIVTKVQLIYTSFTTDPGFNQPELNKSRLANLKAIAPEIFNNSVTEWEIVAQKGADKAETAKTFFHGFVITVMEPMSITDRKMELKSMEDLVTHVKIPIYDTIYKERKKYYYLPVSKHKRELGIKYRKKGIWNREKIVEVKIRPKLVKVGEIDSVFINGDYKSALKKPKLRTETFTFQVDSNIHRILNRNKWNKMMLVVDVTGSMGGYTEQVLTWLALETNLKRVNHVVCFNDGDMKPDGWKKTGKTGGIYHSKESTFENITNIMMTAMKNGYGGDGQENDVEAIIDGINTNTTCEEIILIADNWANMRDYSMIKEVNKPVRVIICGNTLGINTEYLDLARATGGSVHTIEDDLFDLVKLNEGQSIKIGDRTYSIHKGKFVLDSGI